MSMILTRFLQPEEVQTLREISATAAGWEPGRQETGYFKLNVQRLAPAELVARSLEAIGVAPESELRDCFLLRYPDGSSIAPHVDPSLLEGHHHARLNALVTPPEKGGLLSIAGRLIPLQPGDAVVFSPDREEHSVTAVMGERLVWSVGALVPDDELT